MTPTKPGKQYRPRGPYWRIRLPFEATLTMWAGIGLRPWTHINARRYGVEAQLRGAKTGFRIDRNERAFRLGRERRNHVEDAINDALPTDSQIRFGRDMDGHIQGWGCVPVQAEGFIGCDRDKFRFRFRGNQAHLTVFAAWADPVSDDEGALTTASVYDFYPGEDYAGDFDSDADMVRCLVTLVKDQEPVDAETNPTYGQILGQALDDMLGRTPRDGSVEGK